MHFFLQSFSFFFVPRFSVFRSDEKAVASGNRRNRCAIGRVVSLRVLPVAWPWRSVLKPTAGVSRLSSRSTGAVVNTHTQDDDDDDDATLCLYVCGQPYLLDPPNSTWSFLFLSLVFFHRLHRLHRVFRCGESSPSANSPSGLVGLVSSGSSTVTLRRHRDCGSTSGALAQHLKPST